MNFVL